MDLGGRRPIEEVRDTRQQIVFHTLFWPAMITWSLAIGMTVHQFAPQIRQFGTWEALGATFVVWIGGLGLFGRVWGFVALRLGSDWADWVVSRRLSRRNLDSAPDP